MSRLVGGVLCERCNHPIDLSTDDNYNVEHTKAVCPECGHTQWLMVESPYWNEARMAITEPAMGYKHLSGDSSAQGLSSRTVNLRDVLVEANTLIYDFLFNNTEDTIDGLRERALQVYGRILEVRLHIGPQEALQEIRRARRADDWTPCKACGALEEEWKSCTRPECLFR